MMNKNVSKARRIVLLAVLVSQAAVLSVAESWIPVAAVIPFPGIKLGLANIITLMVIIFFGWRDALFVAAARSLIASLIFGGPTAFVFSLAGGIASALVMSLVYEKLSSGFSLTGVSIAGAVTHNAGQTAAACILMKTAAVAAYMPVLLVSGIITGFFIGVCGSFLSQLLGRYLTTREG